MAKKRGLGRGLNALLSNTTTIAELTQPKANSSNMLEIDLDLISRGPYQPRVHFDEESLQELAESIRSQGVVQPIVLRTAGSGYEIIAGERRWRAAQLAGLDRIPAVIRELDDRTAAAVSLIENIQRENLNPLEESRAFQRLIDEFDMTHQQVADSVSRSRAAVSNLLRLQDLNEDVKHLLETRALEMGHARALLAINGSEQSRLAKLVASKGMSVRETERLVRRHVNPPKKPTKIQADPDILRLEQKLGETLGAVVSFNRQTKTRGKLEITYNSLDELDGILSKILESEAELS